MWLTFVALPGSFRNPDFYDTSTPDIRVTACSMSSGLQTILLTQPYPREAGAIQIAHTHPRPLGDHLASASSWALTWSQCISLASCLSNAQHEITSRTRLGSWLADALLSHEIISRNYDGELGTAAEHLSGKVDLHDRILGLSKQGREESRLSRSTFERYVSMFVHFSIYRL